MYYVYVYLDPRKPGDFVYTDVYFNFEPFYIGKGSGKRKLSHVSESQLKRGNTSPKVAKIRKIEASNQEPIIVEIKTFDNEADAYQEEIRLIRLIGSDFISGIKDGPLTNLILDGTTPPNHRGKTYLDIYKTPERAEEQRKKRHEKQLAVGGFFKGYKHSQESKIKMACGSATRQQNGGHRKGIKHTTKTLAKWRISRKASIRTHDKKYYIKSPDNKTFLTCNIERFCKFFSISYSTLKIAFYANRIPNRGRTKNWFIQKDEKLSKNENTLKRCIFIKI